MTTRPKKGGAGKSASAGGNGNGGGNDVKHPIQQGIEKLYAAGKTPRIRVDARRSDVVVPEHIRERWKESLVIDLDPGYPLDLVYTEDAVHVDLAFSGNVTRCTFPWVSIYGLFDRASGHGVQIPAHVPKDELPEELRRAQSSDEAAKARRAKFRVIPGG